MRDHAVRTVPGGRTRPATRGVAGGALVALTSLLLAVPAALPASATTHGPAVVKVERTAGPLGTVLVSGRGRTLYVDIHDRADHVTCTAACARAWPPLLLARGVTRPVAGTGVKGLGTVRRPGRRLQVTWHKLPLYLFAGDVRPGQIQGQGVGAAFFVVTPTGVLRTVPATATTPTSAPSTSAGAPAAVTPTTPQPTTSMPGGTIRGTATAPTSPPATSPPVTSPPATSPPVTSPPATSPPTTAPVGGGVAY